VGAVLGGVLGEVTGRRLPIAWTGGAWTGLLANGRAGVARGGDDRDSRGVKV
jgi:hypothetical protein